MSENIDAYPLCWPEGWPRVPFYNRERGTFEGTPDSVRKALLLEVDRLILGKGAARHTMRDSVILSTDVPLRRDGEPMAGRSEPVDPGVAIYFERDGKRLCFACDKYDRVWKNMRAIQKTIEALRGIERWGSSDMLDRAFTGFTALPAPGPRKWHEVMGIPANSSTEEVRARYKQLARERHPDTGGSHEMFTELSEAWQAFQRERGLA